MISKICVYELKFSGNQTSLSSPINWCQIQRSLNIKHCRSHHTPCYAIIKITVVLYGRPFGYKPTGFHEINFVALWSELILNGMHFSYKKRTTMQKRKRSNNKHFDFRVLVSKDLFNCFTYMKTCSCCYAFYCYVFCCCDQGEWRGFDIKEKNN